MKVIVIEVNENVSTVLNDDGEFMEVSTQDGWQCGMEVDYEVPKEEATVLEYPKKEKTFSLKRIAAIAASVAACLCVAFAIQSLYSNLNTITTYVEVSINPAIRISMNKNGKVIAVDGINNDGTELISKLNNASGINEELSQIINQAVDDGYFSSDNKQVSIIVADNDMVQAEQIERELLEVTADVLTQRDIDPIVRTRRATLEEANNMRQTVDAGVNLGMSLAEVYELSQWSSSNDALGVREIEYKGNNIAEIEFSSDLLYTGKEKITVTDSEGNELACKLKSQSSDEWNVEIASIEEGKIYYVKIEAFNADGTPLIFSGAFLARDGFEATATLNGFSSEAYCFENGIKFLCDNDDIYSSNKTVITLRNADGDVYTADDFIMEDDYWLIYTDKISPGDIFSIQITGITDNKRKDTAIYEICKAMPGSNSAARIMDVKFDVDDGELEIKFEDKIAWSGKPVVTVTDINGSPFKVNEINWDDDDIEVVVTGVTQPGKYNFTVKDSGGFSADISGSFIVQ